MKRHLGLTLLLLLALHSLLKLQQGLWPELFWGSHVTSLLLAIALLLNWSLLSAAAFLFHLGIALPVYSAYLLGGGDWLWSSVLLHLLTPLFGWLVWRREQLPLAAIAWGLGIYAVVVLLARLFTPNELNINFAYSSFDPLQLPSWWLQRLSNLLLVLIVLSSTRWLYNYFSWPYRIKGQVHV